ncbi:hypothetical protein [Brevibacterium marinum]|uniref:Uncharacterized protein n=1 Tax=Brevibacterium marinum TaxID=418643 RepID=A0A846SB32_9MICO|nr:hypothetical protein [Brevibacterium marinum]NJC57977.1 hypothetical protein [Brevibacterium marinum]
MSEDVQEADTESVADAVSAEAFGAEADTTASVEDRSQVRAHDGQPVSDEMASAAAVAAVVAIRQVALAYAADQVAALDQMETDKRDRAGFNAPRRNVRRPLPHSWTQTLGR